MRHSDFSDAAHCDLMFSCKPNYIFVQRVEMCEEVFLIRISYSHYGTQSQINKLAKAFHLKLREKISFKEKRFSVKCNKVPGKKCHTLIKMAQPHLFDATLNFTQSIRNAMLHLYELNITLSICYDMGGRNDFCKTLNVTGRGLQSGTVESRVLRGYEFFVIGIVSWLLCSII